MRNYVSHIGLSISLCSLLFALCSPPVFAQEEKTLYMRIKESVEQESVVDFTELPIQRFALGVYHDNPVPTALADGTPAPLNLQTENDIDYALQGRIRDMCGDQTFSNHYATCVLAQESVRQIVQRNAWHRRLGRDLQAIASGYETGIDGYPGKQVDILARIASIAHLWRSGSDPFSQPILEVLTFSRPWPEGEEDTIEAKGDEIADLLKDLIRTWQPPEGEKREDNTEMIAAIHRYRNGVQYVIDREGPCDAAPEFPENPANIWLEKRWCSLEEKLTELHDIIALDDTRTSSDEDVLYPSIINKKQNLYIWIRKDDVGLQQYVSLEPVQAALYQPDFGDCLASQNPHECYATSSGSLVRGGEYPRKVSGANATVSLTTDFDPEALAGTDTYTLPDGSPDDGSVVPEPKEGDGICSHPFGKRGYLCRTVESENCRLSETQKEELALNDESGIVLTRCQPEHFRDDTMRKQSGPNICSIGGWRADENGQEIKDTAERQEDIRPSACAPCAVDVVCSDRCGEDPTFGRTEPVKRNGVIEICMPNGYEEYPGFAYYLLAHELTHAGQICSESDIGALQLTGGKSDPEACCALEREAYFVQCKMMALDGVLERAGVSLDQCASTLANLSCASLDTTPDDDEYICTNDDSNPEELAQTLSRAIVDLAGTLDRPTTCEGALEDPRIQAIYNSFPRSCSPGCQTEYANTIGNNLCYTGQCLEETQEWARNQGGRMGLTAVDEDFPWDSCDIDYPTEDDADFQSIPTDIEVPPALTGPKLPAYRPEYIVQQLDLALCQVNGLPASTPPVLCAFDPVKRLNLPPLTLTQSTEDLMLQPEEYDDTGLSTQFAAESIGARLSSEMFTHYVRPRAQSFADLLNMAYHLLDEVSSTSFPTMMCPRIADGTVDCSQFAR